jgi:hypothetical protein
MAAASKGNEKGFMQDMLATLTTKPRWSIHDSSGLEREGEDRWRHHHQNAGPPVVRTFIAWNFLHSAWPSSMRRLPPLGTLPLMCGA